MNMNSGGLMTDEGVHYLCNVPLSPETFAQMQQNEPRSRANSWPKLQRSITTKDVDLPGGTNISSLATATHFESIPEYCEAGVEFDVDVERAANGKKGSLCGGGGGVGVAEERLKIYKKPWGDKSYAAIIATAIESSSTKKLTLQEIYEYFISHYQYFADRVDCSSSGGWKNSIRHNLSLHSKFQRVENTLTGKSAFWTINYNTHDKSCVSRRRATVGGAERDVRKAVRLAKANTASITPALPIRESELVASAFPSSEMLFRSKSLVGLTSGLSQMQMKEENFRSSCALPFRVDSEELLLGPHCHLPGDQMFVNLVVDAVVQHHESATDMSSSFFRSSSACSSIATSSISDFSPCFVSTAAAAAPQALHSSFYGYESTMQSTPPLLSPSAMF